MHPPKKHRGRKTPPRESSEPPRQAKERPDASGNYFGGSSAKDRARRAGRSWREGRPQAEAVPAYALSGTVPQLSPNCRRQASTPVCSRHLKPPSTRCLCWFGRQVATMVRVGFPPRIPLGTPASAQVSDQVARIQGRVRAPLTPQLCPVSLRRGRQARPHGVCVARFRGRPEAQRASERPRFGPEVLTMWYWSLGHGSRADPRAFCGPTGGPVLVANPLHK